MCLWMKFFLGALCCRPLLWGLRSTLVLSSSWGKRSELSCFAIFSDLWVWKGFKLKAAEYNNKDEITVWAAPFKVRILTQEANKSRLNTSGFKKQRKQQGTQQVSCKSGWRRQQYELGILPGTSMRCSQERAELTWCQQLTSVKHSSCCSHLEHLI